MAAIEFYCPHWGSENIAWATFFEQVKEAGYDGIEYGVAYTALEAELDEVWNGASKAGLKIIAQHYDTVDADFSMHYDRYCAWMEKINPYPLVKINSQTGKDYFSFEQNKKLIEAAAQISGNVVHETHRNKFSFAAHITKEYLEKIPDLKITLDASHWVCVAESYLEDQQSAMQLAMERTDHFHARVGYPEGPQIPDPRVNEWQYALNKHLAWWDEIVAQKKNINQTVTITPEFGPYPYMVHDPVTGSPIANQWEVNVFMMNLLRKRYSKD
ncbi:sugar phosphate isomerase/epimerase family protein [Flavisolibacter tropicus]|uniref:Xylose isomerase n=1 Tax=Flavisolibacter tropicus TaxID=1492898 RepID=A0A172TRM4_9BACT|nr:xylose isomerase [Flavisolibacter tropicus]ANE49729.1 xylose isomerase [Flavisolibacter tropicus]